MLHEIRYCKHCGKEYSYQVSGEGCLDENNNPNYCPECMAAINTALKKLGNEKRCITKADYDNTVDTDLANEIYRDVLRILEEDKTKHLFLSSIIRYRGELPDGYKHYYDIEYPRETKNEKLHCHKYVVCFNDGDVSVYQYKRYDTKEKRFVDVYDWRCENRYNVNDISIFELIKPIMNFDTNSISVNNLPEPCGKLFWMEPIIKC